MTNSGQCASQQLALTGNPDWKLMDRVQAGDTDAFYDLVRPLERSVYLAAFSILRNEADAEDCAQEAVLKAYQNLARFRREAKFSTWLIQIAINEAKMRLRKDRRHLYDSIDEPATDDDGGFIPRDFADWRAIPSEALEQSELRHALDAALRALPEKYATVLVLRDVQQLSIAETAEALGLTEANVKVRLSRARLQMREALAPGFDGSWMTRHGRNRVECAH
jgi:RNA polymerase sigma-70 factor (ECF subfamily)